MLSPEQWQAWQQALDLWGVQLQPPLLRPDAGKSSFAWFSFPPRVTVDLAEAGRSGVADRLTSIFAHEIGHHVLSPSTRLGSLKVTQQMARAITASADLPTASVRGVAETFANLWSDMLINVSVAERQQHLASDVEPEMIGVWRALTSSGPISPMWWVVMRAYELLWSLPPGSLCPEQTPAANPTAGTHPDLDAGLLTETVRRFRTDPISGALRFGMIAAPYLTRDDPGGPAGCGGEEQQQAPTAAELDEVLGDARLHEQPEHPALAAARRSGLGSPKGEPGEAAADQGYGLAETLALWAAAERQAVLDAWYAARARPYVRPIYQRAPQMWPVDLVPGETELWETDDDPAAIDWPATLTVSPRVIPGLTTRRRAPLADPPPTSRTSVELDLYIDSSGSMPSPNQESPAILAGTIVILSILRAGGRVRVTSFSGVGEVAGTPRFTRNRSEAAAALATYFGGGTTFPLDLLADRYLRNASTLPARRHLLVLSDDGLSSMFGEGQPQYATVAAQVARVLDTGTLMVTDLRRLMTVPAAKAGYDVVYLDRLANAPAACAALAATLIHAEASDHD